MNSQDIKNAISGALDKPADLNGGDGRGNILGRCDLAAIHCNHSAIAQYLKRPTARFAVILPTLPKWDAQPFCLIILFGWQGTGPGNQRQPLLDLCCIELEKFVQAFVKLASLITLRGDILSKVAAFFF